MTEMLRVLNLRKVFTIGGIFSRAKIIAVNDVSFEIKKAEIFTLAGESGCGKTTIAKILLGFEHPTGGIVEYKGRRIDNIKPNERFSLRKEIQAIFQNPFSTFNPLRKVDRYFFEALQNFGIAKEEREAEKIVREKLEAVGVAYEEFREKYPSEFSGGQLQRISIARALLTNPSLLIADEPVSMVDASLRMSIVNLFKDLRDRFGLSILYITHDLATAYYVSDRMAIMFRGEIVELGPAEKVLQEPKHPYTRLLRDSVPEPDPSKRWTSKVLLAEQEHEEYLRMGCKFAGRCPSAMEICKRESPIHYEVDGVRVKCFLYR
ncbi:peptide ABC transporter ATP-binding protein [Pseudothermotoga hypogea DSM 11164 = NBRC 106472]|uniref:Peptide ABC transporter ATP-binding protein n=2 Tax=Thermotogaceae TaxID=188709 RepID=A0A0X1KS80_9THEM|nr:peptide ABC transporter ATP-binding protein [Pseudothermotoga hypogea DSM 11164 = NBRC 106472]